MMLTINFVNLSSIIPTNKEILIDCFGIDYPFNDSRYDFYYCPGITKKRWEEVLATFVPDEWYFFITQTELTPHWENLMDEYNIRKYIVWKSREPAVNYNSPELGPRLTAYLLKGFN